FEEGRDRNRALGIWGAVAGSGGAVGVLLGGGLTSASSWPWIFYVNVPVGVAVIAFSPWLCARAAPISPLVLSTSPVRRRSRPGSCCSSTGRLTSLNTGGAQPRRSGS